MGKIVFWLIVFFAALLVLRLVNIANSRARRGGTPRRQRTKDTAMTRCVNCGVYLPRADAVDGPGGPLCGDAQCLPRQTRGRS